MVGCSGMFQNTKKRHKHLVEQHKYPSSFRFERSNKQKRWFVSYLVYAWFKPETPSTVIEVRGKNTLSGLIAVPIQWHNPARDHCCYSPDCCCQRNLKEMWRPDRKSVERVVWQPLCSHWCLWSFIVFNVRSTIQKNELLKNSLASRLWC